LNAARKCSPVHLADKRREHRATKAALAWAAVEARWGRRFRNLEYVAISWEASRLAGQLRQEWSRKGKTFLLADMIIAAVCVTEALTLVTDNRKDFSMP
jgi:predicted nucleic acid-binding protein